jgi:hypothetical protein
MTIMCRNRTTQEAVSVNLLNGTVTNANGTLMRDVLVEIEGLSIKRRVLTDNEGRYEAQLPPGEYRIIVEHAGFRSFQSAPIGLQRGTVKTTDVRLDLLPGHSTFTRPAPSSMDVSDTVEIDFGRCMPERRRIDVTYGSTTYEIVAKSGNKCVMKYGGESENPNGDGSPNKTCVVPTSLGKQQFKKTEVGVDFSPLEPYCKPSE